MDSHNQGSFSAFHPAVLFVYFLFVLFFSMAAVQPVMLVLSFAGAFCLNALISPVHETVSDFLYALLLFAVMTLLNPVFSHNGETILFFLNEQPYTLEALLYGMAVSAMILTVIAWCRAVGRIMTTDKFLYLFGKSAPKLGLLLSMVFRFLPLYRRKAAEIRCTQKALGLFSSESLSDRLKGSFRVFSSLITWALEGSVNTADTMLSRGGGLPGRKSFSIYRFRKADSIFLTVCLIPAVFLLYSFFSGFLKYSFYPGADAVGAAPLDFIIYTAYAVLVFMPAFIEIKENLKWKYLRSGI